MLQQPLLPSGCRSLLLVSQHCQRQRCCRFRNDNTQEVSFFISLLLLLFSISYCDSAAGTIISNSWNVARIKNMGIIANRRSRSYWYWQKLQLIRGGASIDDDPYNRNYDQQNQNQPIDEQQQYYDYPYEDDDETVTTMGTTTTTKSYDDEQQSFDYPIEHETVQERVDRWKTLQQENAIQMQQSPRDELGRIKLLTSVGKGARASIFAIQCFRNLNTYEKVIKSIPIKQKLSRLIFSTPIIILFILNMAGTVSSLTSPSHSSKKRLKAILNLDKLFEISIIIVSLLRITILPNEYTLKEAYIGNIIWSIIFLLQIQSFTKLSWDDKAAQPISTYTTTTTTQNIGNNKYQQQQQQQHQQTYSSNNDQEGITTNNYDDDGRSWNNNNYRFNNNNDYYYDKSTTSYGQQQEESSIQ